MRALYRLPRAGRLAQLEIPEGAENLEAMYDTHEFFGERTLFAQFELDTAELNAFRGELDRKAGYRKVRLKRATGGELAQLLTHVCDGHESIDQCERWADEEPAGGLGAGFTGDAEIGAASGIPITMVAVDEHDGGFTVYLSAGES